jgi:hypothetical protein
MSNILKQGTTVPWTQPDYLGITFPAKQILPTPCEEIDRDTFLALQFGGSETLAGIDYHQLFIDWDGEGSWSTYENHLWGVSFYWFHTYAVAIAELYGSTTPAKKEINLGKGVFVPKNASDPQWGYRLRFFKLGCQHDLHRVKIGNMYYKETCSKCGLSYNVDTSG